MSASRPIMIKVDVEGYEEEVLKGAIKCLAQETLSAIELETVSPASEQMLVAHGFQRMHYNPFSRTLGEECGDLKASNALFIRNAEFVIQRLRDAEKIKVLAHEV